MAKAIIQGRQHPVRVDEVNSNNYGVSVLTEGDVPASTINVTRRPASLLRYKIHANDAAAAVRRALSLMKEAGSIDDYVLEPGEEPPPPPEPKPAAEKPAAEAKPAAEKPAAEAKPAPEKPAAEKPAAEAKPAPEKPAAEQPAAEAEPSAGAASEKTDA